MIFIGANIKILRKKAGLTQGIIAEFLGVNPNTISNYEKGNSCPDFTLLEKLIKILDIDAHSLLYCDLSLTPAQKSVTVECPSENIFITKTPQNPYKENVGNNVGENVGFPKLHKTPTNTKYPTSEDIPEMQVADVVPVHRFSLRPDRAMEEQQVPVYDSLTLHSLDKLFSNNIEPSSYISIPNLPKCDGAVRMWGDKMSPELKGGDLLVYKKVKDLRSGLFLGQIYLISVEIEGEEYVMVQYLEASECENSVKLVSKNERYPPKDIPLKSIKALAMIKASVRYQPI